MADLTDKSFWDQRWTNKTKGSRDYSWTLQTREQEKILEWALEKVPHGGHILELGIAPGRIAPQYFGLRNDIHIDGIDISESGLEQTRALFDKLGISGELHLSDIREFEATTPYDLVCSHGLIEHFDNYTQMVKYHFDYVRPGGWVFITIPNYATTPVRHMLERFSDETMATHNLDCMSEEALRATLKDIHPVTYEIKAYGGNILPHSAVNPNLGGKLYRHFCRAWNASVSVFAMVTPIDSLVHVWDVSYALLAQKSPIVE
ncbi:MAG TPA: hypothetical protein DCE42_28605 [Myxococcales bacterium]|nr:hypothetical protein [Deltaproteobacteria bacterium]HAA58757.1 hypothetical protein [Myxococcales bacterium]|tara:strand:+ start:631 stop:1413 length:783 start_codon:yes stop_codon:yes gene_type:complete